MKIRNLQAVLALAALAAVVTPGFAQRIVDTQDKIDIVLAQYAGCGGAGGPDDHRLKLIVNADSSVDCDTEAGTGSTALCICDRGELRAAIIAESPDLSGYVQTTVAGPQAISATSGSGTFSISASQVLGLQSNSSIIFQPTTDLVNKDLVMDIDGNGDLLLATTNSGFTIGDVDFALNLLASELSVDGPVVTISPTTELDIYADSTNGLYAEEDLVQVHSDNGVVELNAGDFVKTNVGGGMVEVTVSAAGISLAVDNDGNGLELDGVSATLSGGNGVTSASATVGANAFFFSGSATADLVADFDGGVDEMKVSKNEAVFLVPLSIPSLSGAIPTCDFTITDTGAAALVYDQDGDLCICPNGVDWIKVFGAGSCA